MTFNLKRLFLFNNLLTALLPIICIGLLSLAVVKDHLRTELDNGSEQLARVIVSEINTYIHEPAGTFRLLSNHLLNQHHPPAERTRLLDQVIESYGYYDAIYILDKPGIVQQAGFNRSGQQARSDFIGMDFSGVEICRQAQKDRALHWASSVSMNSGEQNMTFCSPLDSGSILGEIRLDRLASIINETRVNKITISFIVEKDGTIIAHPDREMTRKKENLSNLPLVQKSFAGTVATDTFTLNGVTYRGTAVKIPELDWVLVVAQNEEIALQPLHSIQLIVLTGISATVLLALFLGSVGSRMIRRPFILLADNARKVTHEEYNAIEPLTSRCEEVVALSEALRNMVHAVKTREELLNEQTEELMSTEEMLRELNQNLEEKVEERTAMLETANHDLIRREQSLEIANNQLEAFAYSISHDLRAPLRHISGFASILLDDYGSGLAEDARSMITRIIASCLKMDSLIKALLIFSKATRQEINKSSVHIDALAREIYAELLPDAAGRQIDFKITELPPCQADPLLIRQVITNLLGNALKYTGQKELAVIEVGGRLEGAETVFFVKDNGVGFDSSSTDKLFGVFQRLHSQTEFEGSGVGLAIAADIVHRHGGRIWADAKPGVGATFFFTLTA